MFNPYAHGRRKPTMSDKAVPSVWRYSVFSAVLASAGIPLYIHLPAFLSETYGIGLATLGGLLIALRCLDFVQDPILGLLLNGGKRRVGAVTALAVVCLAGGMVGLFLITAPLGVLVWIALCLALTFTGYSALTILLYADGVARAESIGHVAIATWREVGALLGILTACILPFAIPSNGYAWFAALFAVLLLGAHFAMRGRWMKLRVNVPRFGDLAANRVLRNFLILAFFNALPVAITSTLFVFFVENRLHLPEFTGVFLLAFFAAAAASAPAWRLLAGRFGVADMLTLGMLLAILSFFWAFTLPSGAASLFAVICVTSGAALGADMILLPALFSQYQERENNSPTLAFGMWSFASKASLALAAGVVLPLLSIAGFDPNGSNSSAELQALALVYALLPAALKVIAILWLWFVLRPSGALQRPMT